MVPLLHRAFKAALPSAGHIIVCFFIYTLPILLCFLCVLLPMPDLGPEPSLGHVDVCKGLTPLIVPFRLLEPVASRFLPDLPFDSVEALAELVLPMTGNGRANINY